MATTSVDPEEQQHSDSDTKHKRCVRCNVLQPLDGKFLSCLHVMCAGCLRDSCCDSEESSSVQCTLCSELTSGSAALRGVELEHQLTDYQPLLYAGQRQAPSSDGSDNEQVLCDVCVEYDDEDRAPRSATHQCNSCDGAARLCQPHAEKHGKTRRHAGHSVRELADGSRTSSNNNPLTGQNGSVRSTRRSCAVHRHRDVITYCETCQEAVCEQCLINGHNRHTMLTLKTVADEQRGELREYVARYGTGDSTADPISTLLTEVVKELEAVREEAAAASTVVTSTFTRVCDLLKEAEEDALKQVDVLQWKAMEPLQLRQQNLHSLQARHTSALDLAKVLSSADSEDVDVVRLGKLVSRGLAKLGAELEKEQTSSLEREKITAVVESLNTVEKSVQSLVLVGGEKVVHGGSTIFLQLDPAKCSLNITLSSNGRIATHSGSSNGYSSVVTTEGFTHGRHDWHVKLHNISEPSYQIVVGVTALPKDKNFDGTRRFFDGRTHYGWWSSNGAVVGTSGSYENCPSLQDGDTVSFYLDMDQKTLEIHLHRTGDHRLFTGLKCDEALYPGVSLFVPGHKVELLASST